MGKRTKGLGNSKTKSQTNSKEIAECELLDPENDVEESKKPKIQRKWSNEETSKILHYLKDTILMSCIIEVKN
jgi:hypothetical protein